MGTAALVYLLCLASFSNSSSRVCDSEIHLMNVNGHGTSGQPQANTSNPLPHPE